MKDGKLVIDKTPNGESPLVKGATPILGCDVWGTLATPSPEVSRGVLGQHSKNLSPLSGRGFSLPARQECQLSIL